MTLTDILRQIEKANADNYANNLQAVEALLREVKKIRIFFYPGPGLGHHITTWNLLNRMIGLGLKGDAEILYIKGEDKKKENVELNKLRALIPGLGDGNPPANLQLAGTKVTLVFKPILNWQKPPVTDRVKFGFSGGVDSVLADGADYATFMKIDHLLILQPYKWALNELTKSVICQSSGDLPGDRKIILDGLKYDDFLEISGKNEYLKNSTVLPDFLKRAFFLDISRDPGDFGEFFDKSENFKNKLEPFTQLIGAFDPSGKTHPFHLMPVYGLQLFEREYLKEHQELTIPALSETILFNLLGGIIQAQDHSIKPRSVVVTILSELTDNREKGTYKRLDDFLKGTGEAFTGEKGKFAAYVEKNKEKFRERIKTIAYNDAAYTKSLEDAANFNNRILVVKMGGLPTYAFNHLFKISDLPGVFEGQGTANFMLNVGKPYFQLPSPHNEPHEELYPTLPLSAKAPGDMAGLMLQVVNLIKSSIEDWNSREIKAAFQGLEPAKKYDSPAQALGTVLRLLLEQDKDIYRQYFDSLRKFFNDPREDKFLRGFFFLLYYLKSRPQ